MKVIKIKSVSAPCVYYIDQVKNEEKSPFFLTYICDKFRSKNTEDPGDVLTSEVVSLVPLPTPTNM